MADPRLVTGLFPDKDFGDATAAAEAEVHSIVDHAVA